jgi:L-gulonolactone oxidase
VRVQGAGHSFSQLLPTNDTLLSLDDMDQNNTTAISSDRKSVTVSAGVRLKDLIPRLTAEKLALKNLGSITEQSFAGAALTGTHGTGITKGALPTMIREARLVNGKGEVVTYTRDDEELKGVALSLGALGIVTKVTLDCIPHYQVDYNVYVGKFDAVMANLPQIVRENERVLLWWLFPLFERDDVLIVTKNELDHDRGLLGNAEDRVTTPLGLTGPLGKVEDAILAAIAPQGRGTAPGKFKRILHMKGDYERMLTLPLLPVFHTECEYAIPAQNAVAALSDFRTVVEESDLKLKLPVELRWVAGDDQLLSPCNDGDVCYIGASTEDNTAEVFARFEPIMWKHGGRPHWGKHFTLSRDAIATMYGQNYVDFVKLRDEMDPDRVFSNSFLAHLFG